MTMDIMFAQKSGGQSFRGNTCAQILVTDNGFIGAYQLKSKGEVKHAIKMFCKEVGVPPAFTSDPSGEQSSKEVKTMIRDVGSSLLLLEQSTQ